MSPRVNRSVFGMSSGSGVVVLKESVCILSIGDDGAGRIREEGGEDGGDEEVMSGNDQGGGLWQSARAGI